MLSFANPLFLWGLLGLAVPILVHLINRDLFRPLHFPSIRFILRGKLPVERKRRIRDWLLLALRLLLFSAIIATLARPQWTSTATVSPDRSSEDELVLLVDASASMSGWNSWENALSEIDDLLNSHDSARVGLVVSTSGPTIVEPLTHDRAQIRRILSEIKPHPVAGGHRESIRQALRLFEKKGPARLAILSDFQQTDWAPTTLPEIPSDIETIWIDVAENERENSAILHARALPLPDGGRQIVAEIRNFGRQPAERTLTLSTGGESFDRELSLAPNETRSVSFVLDQSTSSRAELRLDADSLPIDDHYFVWLERPAAIPVLVVAPISEEPPKGEELFFLSRALATRTETEWLDFAVQAIEPADLTAADLRNAQMVFLLGAAPYFNESKWSFLHEYLADGGRILFTPGNAPARQTTLLSQQKLLELEFEGMAGVDHRHPRPHHIGSVQPDSSLDHLFQDEAARTLSHVSIYRYTRLKTDENKSDILLKTSDGDPLLIQKNLGSGVVLATAFPFETGWTDLPLSSAFLPMIRELVAGDLPPDHGIAQFDTGTEISTIAAELNLSIENENLAAIDPTKPGIYLVGNSPIILNSPRSESIVATTSLADLQTAVTPRHTTETASFQAASTESGILPLWPWLASAAFFLFIIEMPFAAYLRRRQRSEETKTTDAPTGATSQPS